MSTTSTAATSLSRRRAAVVVLCLVLAVVLGCALRPAAAAQLPLRPASLTNVSVAERCTPTAAVSNGSVTGGQPTTVLLTGLGTGCGGQPVAVTLFGADGAALTSVTTTLPESVTGSATVIVPAYTPADVFGSALTIGTWGVPATWTYAPPATVPTVTCTVLNDPTGTKTCSTTTLDVTAWGYPRLDTTNIVFYVTSPSLAMDVQWEITINLADPALKVYSKLADAVNVELAPGWSCSSMPMLVLRGNANTRLVGGGHQAGVQLQGKATSGPTTGGNLFNCS